MFRTIIWFIYFFLYLFASLPSLWKANRLKKQGKDEEHSRHVEKITTNWAKSLLKLAGIKVHVHGKENIPKDEVCLIVSNHQGSFDIPVLMANLGGKIGFISKVEVKKLPIAPSWMEHMNCVFMDRKDRRQSVKAIIEGAERLKEGNNVMIFPEGTRSKGGPVSQFKKGSFNLATRSGVAILPITIEGSYLALEETGKITPAEVHMTISQPIRVHQGNPKMDTEELAEIVQLEIESKMTHLKIK